MSRAPFWIARLAVVRMLRERSNLFFVFAFPVLLVLLIGVSFGGDTSSRVLVVGPDGARAVHDLEAALLERDDAVEVIRLDRREGALEALSRRRGDALVIVPDDIDATLADGTAVVEFVVRQDVPALRPVVEGAVLALGHPIRTVSLARALGADGATTGDVPTGLPPAVTVRATELDADPGSEVVADRDPFTRGASTQLVLFVFLTTLGGATRIVEGIDLGTTRRMLASPNGAAAVVLGEGLGRFAVAVFQALWVVVASLLLFGVQWGDPLAAALVVTAFAAASAGAGLLLGAVARTSTQATGLATLFGLTLAALGGSMAPLEALGPLLRVVAHATPHAWANDAFEELTSRGGGPGDVLVEVAVLLSFGTALGGLAAVRLRRRITTA